MNRIDKGSWRIVKLYLPFNIDLSDYHFVCSDALKMIVSRQEVGFNDKLSDQIKELISVTKN